MLTSSARAGLTLVEVMVATVAMLIVAGSVHRLLLTTQRVSRAQAEQFGVQSNVRGAVLAVASELREAATREGGSDAQNDLLSIAAGSVTYRAMRGTGFACQAPTATQVRIARTGFSGLRDPQPNRDSVLVYVDSAGPGADPAWIPLAIVGVSTAASCPSPGGPGITLTVPATPALAATPAGTPVRIYEVMELRQYDSDGHSWLGLRSLSSGEAIQPLFGPLSYADGFRLQYRDAAGGLTLNRTAVRSIVVSVHGFSQGMVHLDGLGERPAEQRLTIQLGLRNAASE